MNDEVLDGLSDDVLAARADLNLARIAFIKAMRALRDREQTLSDAIARRNGQSIELTPMQVIALAERKED